MKSRAGTTLVIDVLRLMKAVGLILVPMLCAAAVFWFQAPGHDPGVYVGTSNGVIYALSEYSPGSGLSFPTVEMKSPIVPVSAGNVTSFFIVGPQSSVIAAHATSSKMYLFVVDHANEIFRSEFVPVPVTVTRINPLVYHVKYELTKVWDPDQKWGPQSAAFQLYQQVLARTYGSRSTMDVLLGLVIPDSAAGSFRIYSVRIGPQ